MPYNVLGINPGHNGSAAVVSDGKLVYYLEEERLSREKYSANPFKAVIDIISKNKIDAVAKAAGAEDCGCNKRRKTLNEIFPYAKKSNPKQPHINTEPLLTLYGKYEVLQEIHCTLPTLGKTTFTKGTILVIDNLHPLYSDIPHYYKNNIIKKL